MSKRNTVLTWEAIYDVTDIADYIESEFSAERADKLQEEIKEQFRLLSEVNVMFNQTGIETVSTINNILYHDRF